MGKGHRFPNISPTSRVFRPGTPATKEFQAQNGAVTLVSYGKLMVNDELDFGFKAIQWSEARQIQANYRAVMADDDYVEFTKGHQCFRDVEDQDALWLIGPTHNRWRYAAAPVFTALTTRVVDVQVKLIKQLLTA
jgi:hypothetical protein